MRKKRGETKNPPKKLGGKMKVKWNPQLKVFETMMDDCIPKEVMDLLFKELF